MNVKFLMILGLLAVSGRLYAEQGCAPGFYPGGNQPNGPICIPVPGYGTTNSTTTSPASGPKWQLTWGAIAMDLTTTGNIGASVGHSSRGQAKREAMARCSVGGAKECVVQLTYKHQCAAVAWPTKVGALGVIAQSGPTIEEASRVALSRCEGYSGDACKIVYSDCTRPVLVRD
jgi:hypothetical protein